MNTRAKKKWLKFVPNKNATDFGSYSATEVVNIPGAVI